MLGLYVRNNGVVEWAAEATTDLREYLA